MSSRFHCLDKTKEAQAESSSARVTAENVVVLGDRSRLKAPCREAQADGREDVSKVLTRNGTELKRAANAWER